MVDTSELFTVFGSFDARIRENMMEEQVSEQRDTVSL